MTLTWLNDEIERRLTDPAEQAKILERIRAGAAPSPSPTRSANARHAASSLSQSHSLRW
jgi:hypothetical protein